MKIKYIAIPLSLALAGTIIFGCKKQIEVGAPITKLATSNVFNSNPTATAAMLSIYAQMTNVPYNLHRLTGLSSDELFTYATDQTSRDLYTNALTAAGDGSSLSFWPNGYNYIYQANAIIENLQQSTGVSSKVKQQLTGEAEFMRAYWYFYLVNLFGDVPLITSTDYKVNAVMPRTAKSLVYQQMVQDLTDAQAKLNAKFVDASDTISTTERIRPTSWAATALLARVYLYMDNAHYAEAEAQATTVISNASLFTLPTDLNTVFKKNSLEAIWQISTGAFLYTPDGGFLSLSSAPSANTANSSTISPQLMSAFEVGDQRKSKWVNSYSNGTGTWYFPYKYQAGQTATSVTEYTMILRLAEQYLIRAEARAQQGNTTGALADLNVIRNRAGLANYVGAIDKASLITAISHERQVELFVEGDRWINLKRAGTIDAVMGGPTGVCVAKGGIWNTNQQLYPILVTDIQNNANLVQNQGY
jgi:hypothetical protein